MSRAYTSKQVAVIRFIVESIESTGCSPSLREIATHFGIASSTAHEHIRALCRRGAIDVLPARHFRGVVASEWARLNFGTKIRIPLGTIGPVAPRCAYCGSTGAVETREGLDKSCPECVRKKPRIEARIPRAVMEV
jgi:hypothetical protein